MRGFNQCDFVFLMLNNYVATITNRNFHFMNPYHYDTIVIGNGLFGSAAACCLAKAGQKILLTGPDELALQNTGTDVFSSHYDSGRVTRVFGWDEQWTEWNYETQTELRNIEAATGVQCFEEEGCLYVTTYADDKQPEHAKELSSKPRYKACDVELLHSDELKKRYPAFCFEPSVRGYIEKKFAGHLNPRTLIALRNRMFECDGGTIIRKKIIATETGNGCSITTADNMVHAANRLLFCCGAFHNFLPGLPRLSMILKSETVLLAGVSEAVAESLTQLPSLLYEIETPAYEGVYMIKPILYPDDKYYLKIGANLHSDIYFTNLRQINDWFNNIPPLHNKEILISVLENLLPDIKFLSYKSKPCIITRTANRLPVIGAIDNHIYICTGCNGYGAMSSGGIGKAAAAMVLK